MTDVELQDTINKKIFFIIISNRKIRWYIQLGDSQGEFGFSHTMYNEFELVRRHFEYTYWLKNNKNS